MKVTLKNEYLLEQKLNSILILGGRIKSPTPCDALSILRPICIAGGEQTLFVVTPDGKLYATGYGAGGRLGIGGTDSMTSPTLVESLQHVFIKKVAVNSGGKHCLALSADGDVFSWGEGEEGKLGMKKFKNQKHTLNQFIYR